MALQNFLGLDLALSEPLLETLLHRLYLLLHKAHDLDLLPQEVLWESRTPNSRLSVHCVGL